MTDTSRSDEIDGPCPHCGGAGCIACDARADRIAEIRARLDMEAPCGHSRVTTDDIAWLLASNDRLSRLANSSLVKNCDLLAEVDRLQRDRTLVYAKQEKIIAAYEQVVAERDRLRAVAAQLADAGQLLALALQLDYLGPERKQRALAKWNAAYRQTQEEQT